NFRTEANVVLVNVTVRDRTNRLVTSLQREEFRLFENKVEQRIAYFAQEEVPVSIGVIFDASGSIGGKIGVALEPFGRIPEPAYSDDEFFLIQFSDLPDLVSDFTTNTAEIQNRLLPVTSKGRTALLDAIYLGMSQMKNAGNPRKAL